MAVERGQNYMESLDCLPVVCTTPYTVCAVFVGKQTLKYFRLLGTEHFCSFLHKYETTSSEECKEKWFNILFQLATMARL